MMVKVGEEIAVRYDDGLTLVISANSVGFSDMDEAGLFADYLFRREPGAERDELTDFNMFWGTLPKIDPNDVMGPAGEINEDSDELHKAVRSKLRLTWRHLRTETFTFVTLTENDEAVIDYEDADISSEGIMERLVTLSKEQGISLEKDLLVSHYDQDSALHVHRVYDKRNAQLAFDALHKLAEVV